jgi:hypothetical protein
VSPDRAHLPYTTDMGVALSFCGHVAHTDCLQGYLKTAAGQVGSHHLNAGAGEFTCPLCRALSNVLVPHEASSWPLAKTALARTSAAAAAADTTDPDESFLQRCGLPFGLAPQTHLPRALGDLVLVVE